MAAQAKTFSRRGKKGAWRQPSPEDTENQPPDEERQAAAPSPAGVPASPQPAAAPEQCTGQAGSRYCRKPAPSATEHEQQELRRWKARMAAYFQEVKDFQLTELTPPPPTPAARPGQRRPVPSPSQPAEAELQDAEASPHQHADQPRRSGPDDGTASPARAETTRGSHSPAVGPNSPQSCMDAGAQPQTPHADSSPSHEAQSPDPSSSTSYSPTPLDTETPGPPSSILHPPAAAAQALSPTPSPGASDIVPGTPASTAQSPAESLSSPASLDSPKAGPPSPSAAASEDSQESQQQSPPAPAEQESPGAQGALTAAKPMALGMSRRASIRRVTLAPPTGIAASSRSSMAGVEPDRHGRWSLAAGWGPTQSQLPRSSLSRPSAADSSLPAPTRLQACPEEQLEGSPASNPATSPPAVHAALDPCVSLPAAMQALAIREEADRASGSASSAAKAEVEESTATLSQPSDLEALMQLTGQDAELPSMAAALQQAGLQSAAKKLGEGTYGEAFRISTSVVKILPFAPMPGTKDGEDSMLSAADILAEAAIMQELNALRQGKLNATSGFIELQSVSLCCGPYSPALAQEWHAWDRVHASENPAVDNWPPQQLFALFTTADGGVDLEHFAMAGFDEARSILLQIALVLAIAEEAMQFEHRDLHWGNLLLRRGPPRALCHKLKGVPVRTQTHGVEVTIIDFTLSRLTAAAGQVHSCDLSADPALFQGRRGDCQADTYRRMRKATKGKWAAFCPATNALWLHYLADILLSCKASAWQTSDVRSLREFRKQALAAGSAGDLVWNELFEGLWLAGA